MYYIIAFFLAHWYLSLFTQTFFLHRYAAHQQFTMTKFWEKFFYVLTFITQGSSFLSPYAYGVMHRMHHVYADREQDPHSPLFSKNLFDMMWKTKTFYNDIFTGASQPEARFTNGVPSWRSFEFFAAHPAVRFGWGVFYTLFYIAYVPTGMWYLYLLLPIHFLMGPTHGAVINWFAHKIGYRTHKVGDTSSNMWPIEIIMMGEGLHNNHHSHPNRSNFAMKWFEFDPTYPVILTLNALRIIRLKKFTAATVKIAA